MSSANLLSSAVIAATWAAVSCAPVSYERYDALYGGMHDTVFTCRIQAVLYVSSGFIYCWRNWYIALHFVHAVAMLQIDQGQDVCVTAACCT